jgi:hypothetical protein
MRRSILTAVLTALPLLFAGTGHTLACNGDKVLFDEDFSFADSSWGDLDKYLSIKDGSATIKADSQHGYKALNNAFLFEDADVCVTVTAVEISKPEESAGGLLFWAKDLRNLYYFLIAPNGYFKIARQVNGSAVNPPYDWTQSDAVIQGVNQPNKLRLTIKGQTIAVEINSKPVARLRAQSPGSSSLIGLYGESSDKTDTWKYNDLKVTNVK